MQDTSLQRTVIDWKSKSPKISVGPREDGASTRRSSFDHLRKKLAPRVLASSTDHHAASTTRDRRTFAQVVMAGGPSARFLGGGAGGAGDRPRPTTFRQLASRARGTGRQREAEHGRGRGRGRGRGGAAVGAGTGAGAQEGRRGQRDEATGAAGTDVHGTVGGMANNSKSKGSALEAAGGQKEESLEMQHMLR
jgi:hypothetical protein